MKHMSRLTRFGLVSVSLAIGLGISSCGGSDSSPVAVAPSFDNPPAVTSTVLTSQAYSSFEGQYGTLSNTLTLAINP